MDNHTRFQNHLAISHDDVRAAALWLLKRGNIVEMPASTVAPSHEEWKEHADEGDLFVVLKRRVEVKRLSRHFTCEQDWPFPTFIVCAKHSYDNANPKPFAYLYFNKSRSHVAILKTTTYEHWTVDRKQDSRYEGVSQEFYVTSPQFATFMEFE